MSASFAVVNLRDGNRKDVQPFLLQNDAFPVLENAYLFRGRIQRRSCFTQVGGGQGRLRWQIGTTGASPFTTTLADITINTGIAQFTIGSVILTDPGGASPVTLLSTDATYAGTLNRATGALSITHPAIAATAVYYYPGLPVMGLRTREQDAFNDELLIGFDTRYSYIFDTGTNDFIAANTFKTTAAVFIWTGTDSDFFWSTNYSGAMFTTNNVAGLNAYTISNGTNATPSVVTIGVGHNLANGDIVMIVNTNGSTTLNGRTFQVQNTNPGAGTFEINNTVAPGGAYNSGYVIVLNRQVNSIAGTVGGSGIKWYDGPGGGTGWVNFVPPLNAETSQRLLRGCLMLLPYKDRLIALNTIESTGTSNPVNFKNRVRWCQNGTPFFTEDNAVSPVEYLLPTNQTAQYDAWFDGTVGKGGFLDAPTNEAIVSAEFVKDTLIVYFERSTWQLVYTGNETLPFVFQKINTELGCESTFSIVPFDRGAFGIGNYGIITTDSVNVVRIDEKIPDEVFQIQNTNSGVKRAYGIRDYSAQLVYWTYPVRVDEDNDNVTYTLTYPNQVLVYNYLDGSWAEFDDCFTCFGYFQKFSDITWASLARSWESTSLAWNSGVLQARYPDVIAGNQRGFVMIFSQLQQLGQNSPSLHISDITTATRTITCPSHNLTVDQYVLITGVTGTTGINSIIYRIMSTTVDTFVIDGSNTISGTYTGGGVITHVPNINITTKQFNPFYENGKSVRLNYVDVFSNRTDEGEVSTGFYTSTNVDSAISSGIVLTSPEPSTSYSDTQQQIWHRLYPNVFGSFFQLKFFLSDDQMKDLSISTSDIKIQGLIFYVDACGRVSYDI